MKWPKPTRSRTLYADLNAVLDGEPEDLVSHVLTLCILFEDLRLELGHLKTANVSPTTRVFVRRPLTSYLRRSICVTAPYF